MGEVFRARDTRLNRDVAVKVLPKDFVSDADRLRRFEQEAKTLAALNHPNVLTIHDAGIHDGAPYLVSELLEGKTLREEMNSGALPVRKATEYALQIAHGLAAANGKGVIHRDLKPENIFVTKDGRVKILDFGLAKLKNPSPALRAPSTLGEERDGVRGEAATIRIDPDAIINTTEPGQVLGTPAYMSPEQVRGEPADHRADIFAFGCVLYEMLSGTRAFRRKTPIESMHAVLNETLPELSTTHPNIPLPLARIVERCLEKEPNSRFQSASDLAFALSALAGGSSAARSPAGKPVAGRPAVKRYAWPAIAGVLVVALAIVSVTWRQPKSAVRASQIRSLAVLPFRVDTQDPKLSELGKWIPADIRTKLGPLQDLQVVNSPMRVEQLLQQKRSEVEIARELGVDGLVMGELHGQGESLSAYVSVVDGATGRALGKQREIASAATKVSELPSQVALAIVDELKLQLDTNYTRAWTGLANSEWIPFIYGGTTNEMAATFKRLSGEAERIRAQRPDDPAVAGLRMWMALLYERDWNKVRTTFWESQRNPKPESWVWNAMSWYYTFIEGHPELALNARQQTIAMDPENLLWQIDRAHQLTSFGQYDEALRLFRSFPPEKILLEDYSFALLGAGDLTGAKEVATRVLAGRPNAWTQCYLAAIHAKSGASDEARKILQELEAQAEKGMHIPFARIAWSYGMVGDFEAARRWLRKGLLEGHGDWTMLDLRTAKHLEMFGKLAWYWEIVDAMRFPPLQMDNPYFALEQQMRYGRGTVGAPTTSTSTNEPPKTLAVLPFANTSADKTDDSFSDGMTEELITSLQKIKGLRVQGRMSSFYFKGKNETPQRVGEQLKVEHLLNGSVSREGSRLRISADLVTAASGFSLWSTNYDRQLADTFAIRTEVAQQVAQALKIQLGMEETRSLAQKPTANPEAHRLYLLGRYHFGKATQAGWSDAIQAFNQAIQLDPSYALAYCGLADNYNFLGGVLMPGKEAWAKEKDAAQKAVSLDPNLADAHLSLAMALAGDYDWSGVDRAIKRALELNPNLALARDQYAWVLTSHGRFDEAAAQSKLAVELDPLSPLMHLNRGYWLNLARRFDEANTHVRKALELDPNSPWALRTLGWSLLWKGDKAGALPLMEKARSLDADPFSIGSFGYALAVSGDRAKAGQILRDLEDLAKQRYVSPSATMVVYLGLGEKEKALEWLEKCYEDRDPLCWFLKVEPYVDSLRTEPRFQALLKKVGLDP